MTSVPVVVADEEEKPTFFVERIYLRELSQQQRGVSAVKLKSGLVVRFVHKQLVKRVIASFQAWKSLALSLYSLRRQLAKLLERPLRRNAILFRFTIWKCRYRRRLALRLLLASHWYRKRRHAFVWWRRLLSIRFERHELARKVLYYLSHRVNQRKVQDCHRAAATIQRGFWSMRNRSRFKASKVIKRFIWQRRALALVKFRKSCEKRRAANEKDMIAIIQKRASDSLQKLLAKENALISNQYLASVSSLAQQIAVSAPDSLLSKSDLFPRVKVPEMANCWTVRAKALCLLNLRLAFEAKLLALDRFRQLSPPAHECANCRRTFVLREEKILHQRIKLESDCVTQGFLPDISDCLCWNLSQPILEAALRPLYILLEVD